jgi:hypothetical protein
MNWGFALGCVLGGAAVVLILNAKRMSRYCVSLWRVVASVEPRQRGAGASAPTHVDEPRAESEERVRGAK